MSAGTHLVVDTLAGSATVSMRKHVAWAGQSYCVEVGSVLLDPAEVLELATRLTRAAVPDLPQLKRRLLIRQRPDGKWFVVCPECFPLDRAWHDQPAALAGAFAHLEAEHSPAAEAAAAARHGREAS